MLEWAVLIAGVIGVALGTAALATVRAWFARAGAIALILASFWLASVGYYLVELEHGTGRILNEVESARPATHQ